MLSYDVKCKKNAEIKNPKVSRIRIGKIMLLLKWALCEIKKSSFIKQWQASRLLTSLEIMIPFK